MITSSPLSETAYASSTVPTPVGKSANAQDLAPTPPAVGSDGAGTSSALLTAACPSTVRQAVTLLGSAFSRSISIAAKSPASQPTPPSGETPRLPEPFAHSSNATASVDFLADGSQPTPQGQTPRLPDPHAPPPDMSARFTLPIVERWSTLRSNWSQQSSDTGCSSCGMGGRRYLTMGYSYISDYRRRTP